MIVVKVTQSGLTVDGHAGYAETGKDIVCAAVSALTQNLVNSMEALTDDRVICEMQHGYINITWENLSEASKLLVDSFFIGICSIIEAYGDQYVCVA